MATLNLGVLVIAYSTAHTGDMAKDSQTTTGAVAEELEKRYHVMENFFKSRKQKIADWLADDMAYSIQDLIKRGRSIKSSGTSTTYRPKQYGEKERLVLSSTTSSITYGADQKIEAEFRKFLASNELGIQRDTMGLGGTVSAKAGVSHRFKDVYNTKGKRKARPFLIDTGTYSASFRAWSTR